MKVGAAFLAAGLLVAAIPSTAGAQTADTTANAPGDPETNVDKLHLPGYGSRVSASSLELEIAPQIASHNMLGAESRTSASTDVTLIFITTHKLSEQFEMEFDAGPSVSIDGNGVSGSSLAAALELRTKPDDSGVSAFARYGAARDFEDFFGAGIDTVQSVTAGLRYGTSIGPAAIGFELAPRWVNSSHDLDDYLAGELFVDAVFPVIGDGIILIAEMSVDRRWYRDVDPAISAKRRDWRVQTFIGLDFADALAPASGGANPIRSLGVGVRWLDISSNLDSADRSSIKLLPAVTAGLSF